MIYQTLSIVVHLYVRLRSLAYDSSADCKVWVERIFMEKKTTLVNKEMKRRGVCQCC